MVDIEKPKELLDAEQIDNEVMEIQSNNLSAKII